MTLEDISDDSEYTIDDRKYYSQTFKIKVRGYIIRKEDYTVERIPSRLVMSSHDSDASGIINRRGKNRREDEKVKFITVLDEFKPESNKVNFLENALKKDEQCEVPPLKDQTPPPPEILEPLDGNDDCCEKYDRYYNKIMKVIMTFDECVKELSFQIDKDMVIDHIEVDNIYDFKIAINDEFIEIEENYKIIKGDKITVKISRENDFNDSEFTIVGYDPNEVIDKENIPEVSIDEKPDEEHILINPKEE
jgi:hypothetical protein